MAEDFFHDNLCDGFQISYLLEVEAVSHHLASLAGSDLPAAGQCAPASLSRLARIGLKDICRLFNICPRHLRRLQNKLKLFQPQRRPGSVRVAYCPPEEIARLAAYRIRCGKGFVREEAVRLGCLELLEKVEAEVFREAAATNPRRHAELRYELMVELLVFGENSPLAQQMQIPALEIRHQAAAARATLAELIRTMPSARAAMGTVLRDSLVSQAVRAVGCREERSA